MSNEGTVAKRKADALGPPKKWLRMSFDETIEVVAIDEDDKPLRTFTVHKDLLQGIGDFMRIKVKSRGTLKFRRDPEAIQIYLNWLYDKTFDIAKHAFVPRIVVARKQCFTLSEERERDRLWIGRIVGLFELWDTGSSFEDFGFMNMIMDVVCKMKLEQQSNDLLELLFNELVRSMEPSDWVMSDYASAHAPMRWLIDLLANYMSGDGLLAATRSTKEVDDDFRFVLMAKVVERRDSKQIKAADYQR